jgi:predicted RNA binding protein YcfA (HicA-like mRNA interferase family)
MLKLPRISGARVIRALERLGFAQARQRGSHVVMRKVTPEGEVGCVVPLHDELAVGTLRGILRQARVTPDQFLQQLTRR